jgi:hypothetical protein
MFPLFRSGGSLCRNGFGVVYSGCMAIQVDREGTHTEVNGG